MAVGGKNFSSKAEYKWDDYKTIKTIPDDESRLTVEVMHREGKVIISGKEYPCESFSYGYEFAGSTSRLNYFNTDHVERLDALRTKALDYIKSITDNG